MPSRRELTDTQRASLAYFVGVEPPADSAAGQACRWLLVQGDRAGNWRRHERWGLGTWSARGPAEKFPLPAGR